MRHFRTLFLLSGCMVLSFASCSNKSGSNGDGQLVEMSDPKMVLQAVFDVANGKQTAVLGTLCDPAKQNDLDTQRICDMAENAGPDAEFVLYFKDAKITGEPRMDGDTAWLPFEFGPSPARADEMQFIRRNGKWFLFSF